MKKRHLISALAMVLALMLPGLSCAALAEGKTFGVLSFLNLTEEEDRELGAIRRPMEEIRKTRGRFFCHATSLQFVQ